MRHCQQTALLSLADEHEGGGRKAQFQDDVDITIPKRVMASEINEALGLMFGCWRWPKGSTQWCALKMADTCLCGVTKDVEVILA